MGPTYRRRRTLPSYLWVRWIEPIPATTIRVEMENTVEQHLTADLVKSLLTGHTPANVQKHWVDVDGVRWPATQVLAIVTGEVSVKSNRARRELQRLGFTLGESPAVTSVSRAASPVIPRSRLIAEIDVAQLAPMESVHFTLSYTWLRAGFVTLNASSYPVLPPLPDVPGMYRFDFGRGDDGRRTIYIGEGKSIRARGLQYRNAKRDRKRALTSRRMHRAMVVHLQGSGVIEMSVIVEASMASGDLINLGRKSGRLVVESAAVVLAQIDPAIRVLNIDEDPEDATGSKKTPQ